MNMPPRAIPSRVRQEGETGQTWLWGPLGEAIHSAVVGLVVAMLPAVHPEIPEHSWARGPYYKNYGPLTGRRCAAPVRDAPWRSLFSQPLGEQSQG